MKGEISGLDRELIREILEEIHKQSLKRQS
jgi:hypothetical protein